MDNPGSDRTHTDQFCQELRERYERRQADLQNQFNTEIDLIPHNDIVTFIRVKLKYRQLGLQF